MIRPLSSIIFATLLLNVALACSKNPDSQETQAPQPRQKERSTQPTIQPDLFLPLGGQYEGTLVSADGSLVQKVTMTLIPTQRRSDDVEIPTLSGSVSIVFSETNASDVIPIAEFSSAGYAPETGRLQLSGTMNTRTLVGAILNTFDGTFAGDVIRGRLSNSTRGDLGQLELRKINSVAN
ncbi:MAG: hypothetical protein IPJ84_20565 [Bdellovibrionales bacterium]|nr:hypothetical protein [Bdellovibrionales bacterium]